MKRCWGCLKRVKDPEIIGEHARYVVNIHKSPICEALLSKALGECTMADYARRHTRVSSLEESDYTKQERLL